MYVFFHNATLTGPHDDEIAHAVMTYWSNFGTTGDPNKGAAVAHAWPAYSDKSQLVIDYPFTTTDEMRPTKCDFWDAFDKEVSARGGMTAGGYPASARGFAAAVAAAAAAGEGAAGR